MKHIAFLGIGAMGERIATNLINAGYQLHVWNRTADKCQNLVEKGATAYNSPQKAVQNVDVAIAMIADDRASREVWLDPKMGAINGLKPRTIVMEFSTLTPGWCRELASEINQHNCEFLDSPVVGSRPQAETNQLIHLVGGNANTLKQVRKVLQANSQAIHHVGEIGTGMTMKLGVNALFAIQVAALSEILGILNNTGISIDSAINLLNQIPTTSPALKGIGMSIKNQNYAPLFPINLVVKDLLYAKQLGESVDAKAPAITIIKDVYQQAQKAGYDDNNIAGVARLFL